MSKSNVRLYQPMERTWRMEDNCQIPCLVKLFSENKKKTHFYVFSSKALKEDLICVFVSLSFEIKIKL